MRIMFHLGFLFGKNAKQEIFHEISMECKMFQCSCFFGGMMVDENGVKHQQSCDILYRILNDNVVFEVCLSMGDSAKIWRPLNNWKAYP